MPLRPALLCRRVSVFDLPILPFLAPRVFQPWPSQGRRNYSTPPPTYPSPLAIADQNEIPEDIRREHAKRGAESKSTSNEQLFEISSSVAQQANVQLDEPVPSLGRSTRTPPLRRISRVRRIGPILRDQQRLKIDSSTSEQAGIQQDEPMLNVGGSTTTSPFRRRSSRRLIKRRSRRLLLPQRSGSARSKAEKRDPTKPLLQELRLKRALHPRYSGPVGDFLAATLRRRFLFNLHEKWGRVYRPKGFRVPGQSVQQLNMNYESYFAFPEQLHRLGLDPTEVGETPMSNVLHGITVSLCEEEWRKLDHKEKGVLWPKLMLSALSEHPEKTVKFITATYCEPYPKPEAIADGINYIIRHYLKDLRPSDDNPSLFLYRTVTSLLLHGPADYVYLHQASIYRLMINLPSPQLVVELYKTMLELNNPMTKWTLAQFASLLSKAGPDFEEIAFEIIQRLGDMRINFNSPMMQSLCTTVILHSSPGVGIGHSEKFEYMVQCGLIPNIITFNVLLLMHLRDGDHEGSWRIYEMMEESGPEPDAYTYSTLLNDAKKRRDTYSIQKVMDSVNAKAIRSSHIVVDILHSTLLFTERDIRREAFASKREGRQPMHRAKTSFEQMLPYYCKHFHFPPLAHLLPGLAEQYPELMDQAQLQSEEMNEIKPLIDPPSAALIVMLTALLKDYKDPDTPKWFYEHWKKLVEARDPFVVSIAKEKDGYYFTVVYDVIMMALGQNVENLPLCLRILGEMSKRTRETSDDQDTNNGQAPPIHPPKPTVATWNILAGIFMKHRQPRAAEKVLTMMRERGIEPSPVTWNVILAGYVRMQDVKMAVDTADRHVRHGHSITFRIYNQLKKLEDRRAMIEGMRRTEMERLAEELEQRGAVVEGKKNLKPEVFREEQFVVGDMKPRVLNHAVPGTSPDMREEINVPLNGKEREKLLYGKTE